MHAWPRDVVQVGAALSDVRGRHRFLNVDLNGSCGLRTPWGVLFLSVARKQSAASLRRCHINAFLFFLGGEVQGSFGPFLFSLVM